MSTDAISLALVAAMISALALGSIVVLGERVQAVSRPLSIAAGGMLLTLVAFHIAPEALAHDTAGWLYMVVGAALGLGLQMATQTLSQLRPERTFASPLAATEPGYGSVGQGGAMLAIAPLAAIALHSLIDGAIYALAFAGGQTAGLYAASALIIHEIPEAFVAFAIVASAGLSARNAVLAAMLAATITTPIGAMLGTPLVSLAGGATIPALYALSAGLLTYVALGPLLSPLYNPPSHDSPLGIRALGTGIALAAMMLLAPLPHLHGQGHGALDGGTGPVHAHVHDHPSDETHAHPNFAPFR